MDALLQVFGVTSYDEIDIQSLCYLVNAMSPSVTTIEELIVLEHDIEREIILSQDQQADLG